MLRRLVHDYAVPAIHQLAARSPACSTWWNRLRRLALPRLDGVARRRWDRPLLRDKTRADGEWVATAASLCAVERALRAHGYRRNPLATLKVVRTPAGRVYERASWAYHDDVAQYHCYLFVVDGVVQVHHHREPSYLHDPEGHQDGSEQDAGDPDGVLAAALDGCQGVVWR